MGKYDTIKSHYQQAKAERDQQAALYSEEHTKHEGTEQKLAQTKAELASLKAKQEDFLIVVCGCIVKIFSISRNCNNEH